MKVVVDSRTFIVKLDANNDVSNVYERKIHAPGKPWECYWNSPFYNAKNYNSKNVKRERSNSLLRRILAAVEKNKC